MEIKSKYNYNIYLFKINSLIKWCVDTINSSNNSKDELNRIVKLINEVLKDVLKDANILPNFSHFCSKYLPSEIKREEARLVKIQGDLIFIRLDYYTDIVHISQDTQYNINSSISKKINEVSS